MDCDGSWSGLWGRGGWGVTYRSQQNDRDVPQMFVLSEVFSLSDGRFQISSLISEQFRHTTFKESTTIVSIWGQADLSATCATS